MVTISNLSVNYVEKTIQKRLAQEIPDAKTEFYTAFGRIDILTPTQIIEIKSWKNWKHGLGQLIAYSPAFRDRTLRLHCFGEQTTTIRHAVFRLFDTLSIDIILTEEPQESRIYFL
jgi:hypothetical protein